MRFLVEDAEIDGEHLAWWERSKKGVLENLGHDRRVCIMYANFKAQHDGVLESGFIRFFGKVELIESGPVHAKIFSLLLPREQTHAGAEAYLAALQDKKTWLTAFIDAERETALRARELLS